jgi:CCR4-NOT transcription complex subunit 1
VSAGGDTDAPISAKDLEGSSNTFFSTIYHGEMTVPQLVETMKDFASHDRGSWKHEVYSRVVSRLLDESRLFPKYSLHDLNITAEFLGLLINHDLVHASDLDLAHSCVLEALRRPMHTKMFRFGVLALEQFLDRLPAFPALCQDLARIQDLLEAFPEHGRRIKDVTMAVPEESPCGAGRRAREERRRRAAPSKLFRVVTDSGFRAISSFAENAPIDSHARSSEGPSAIEGFPKLKLMPLYQGPWRLNI